MSSNSTEDAIRRIESLRRSSQQRAEGTDGSPSRCRALAEILQQESQKSPRHSAQRSSLLRDVRECAAVYDGSSDASEVESSRDPFRNRKRCREDSGGRFCASDYVKLLLDAKVRDARRAQTNKMNHLSLSRLEEMQSMAEGSLSKVTIIAASATALTPKRTPGKKRK